MQVAIERKNTTFNPDASRVIARFLYTNDEQALNTIKAVLNMSDKEASFLLSGILRDFSLRHRNISRVFEKHGRIVEYSKEIP